MPGIARRVSSVLSCVALSSPALAQELRTIGVVDGAPLYSGVSSIAFDARRGIVFVADPVQNVVFAFDFTGELVQRIGRQGAGPGDFNTPVGIVASPDGTLWVRDRTRVQLFRWERVGEFEGFRVGSQFPGLPMPDWNTREPSYVDSAGARYFYQDRSSGEPRNSYQVYTREGAADGRIVVPVFPNLWPYTVWVRTSSAGGRMVYGMLAPPFAARPSWAITSEGTLLSAGGIKYEVTEADAVGRPIRMYRRDHAPVRIPAQLRADSTMALRRRLDSISVPLSQVIGLPDSVRLRQLPEYFPAIVDVLTSRSGARVVRRWTFGMGPERTEFDFFSRAGAFMGTGSASVSFARRPQPIIACGFVFGVTEDADSGEQVVVRARLDRCW